MGVGTVSMSFFRAHFFRVKSLALTFFFTKFEKSNITYSGIQVFCVSWGEGNRFENSWLKLQCVTETLGADWRQEVNFVSRGLRNRQRVLLYRKRIFYKGMHSHWILIDETHCEILSISQFQPRPRPPSPGLLRGISPPCQSRGWGICKFCAAGVTGICQPQVFDTQTILLEKQDDWLICQGREKIEEDCKGMFSILCMHFFIAYQARITHERNSEAIDVNQRFFGYWIKFPLILFEDHPFILKP